MSRRHFNTARLAPIPISLSEADARIRTADPFTKSEIQRCGGGRRRMVETGLYAGTSVVLRLENGSAVRRRFRDVWHRLAVQTMRLAGVPVPADAVAEVAEVVPLGPGLLRSSRGERVFVG